MVNMLTAHQHSERAEGEDKGKLILTLSWAFTALGATFVALRLFVQTTVRKNIRSEDCWSGLTMVRPFQTSSTVDILTQGSDCYTQLCIIVSSILSTVSVSYGNGRHFDTLTTQQKEGVILWMMSAYVPGIPSLGLGKLAVIALLTRLLFPGRLHYWALWVSGSLCVAILITTVCLLMLQCSPPRALWDFSVEGKCMSVEVLIGMSFLAGSEYPICCAAPEFVMHVNRVTGSSFFSMSGLLSCHLSRVQITQIANASEEKVGT